jgi:MFS family permease
VLSLLTRRRAVQRVCVRVMSSGSAPSPQQSRSNANSLRSALQSSVLRNDFVEPESVLALPHSLLRAVGIMAASQFIVTAAFGVVIPILPQFASDIGLGTLGVGAIVSAPSGVRVLLNLKMGVWADRFGRRPLMVLGTLASAVAGFGTAFATSFATMMPFRFLAGLGSSASMVGSSAFMADLTQHTPRHRAKLLGFQQTISGLSFVAGPAIGGILAEAYGARTAFYLVGVSAGLCSIGYSFLPETVKHPERLRDIFSRQKATPTPTPPAAGVTSTMAAAAPGVASSEHEMLIKNPKVPPAATIAPASGDAAPSAPAPPAEDIAVTAATVAAVTTSSAAASGTPASSDAAVAKLSWRELLRNPTQQAVLVVVSATCMCYAAQIAVVPMHLMHMFSMGAGDIGLLFSVASGIGIFGAPVGGWVADRFGRKVAIAVPTVTSALSAVLLTVATTPLMFTGLMVTWSLSLSLLNPGLTALAADIAPDGHRGATLALSRQASDIVFTMAPLALGALAAAVNCEAALAATAGTVAASFVFFMFRAKPPPIVQRSTPSSSSSSS